MLTSQIQPNRFNGRRHKYTAFIFNVKKINTSKLLSYLKKRFARNFDFIIEPKYDGLYVQISKLGSKIKIYSDQGNELTSNVDERIIEALQNLDCQSLVAEGELETYLNKKHQPRGITIGLIHKKEKLTQKYHMVLTLFDCLYLDGKDLSSKNTLERLKALSTLHLKSQISPLDIFLNQVPYARATSLASLNKIIRSFCKIKHFEGVIIKPTSQSAKTLTFIKFKRYIEFALQVIKKIPTKTPSVYNYDVGALNEKGRLELVARTHNSRLSLSPGTKVAVAAYNVSLYVDQTGKRIRVRLYSSTIQNETNAPVNTIKTIIKTAKDYHVLEIHKIT